MRRRREARVRRNAGIGVDLQNQRHPIFAHAKIHPREAGRFEITHVPAEVRDRDRQSGTGVPVARRYERVTFDKDKVSIDTAGRGGLRAELITPGHPLLKALIATTLERHGSTLSTGTTFIDPTDEGDTPRILIYLEHTITDGRLDHGARTVVSRRFQYVEITADGDINDPGAEPYLGYEPLDDRTLELLANVDTHWADDGVDQTARSWATATPSTRCSISTANA